ncbi:MAG: hypothetical protein XD93_1206 [candidate division WS6 bacterium 34_10]|uniref:Uncharacterized protein n=1 Tax=candidate division WS6 bacterium 34_10 TaxID=1641389 RepID=A0A101HFF1_9BACT|nr:MAG: hypothetical protein XD93_1206 [candidate division WS6 bacterium 34_10]
MTGKLDELKDRALKELRTDQDLILLTIFSTLLAAFGVKIANEYVITGSMLISPLFNPILSILVPIFADDKKSFWTSLKSLLTVLLLSFSVGILFWLAIYIIGGYEVISTGIFKISVDNFLVAMILGMVGMLLWIWPKVYNTGAGVAIAISLVPPIAYSTMYLIYGYYDLSLNYFLAFLVNLFGTLIGGSVVLFFYKRGNYKTRL